MIKQVIDTLLNADSTRSLCCRVPELPEEDMTPGRWHGSSILGPRRSKSRNELKQIIADSKRSGANGEETTTTPAQQAPHQAPGPPDPAMQVKF